MDKDATSPQHWLFPFFGVGQTVTLSWVSWVVSPLMASFLM
jgi:hypothetical protein